MADYTLRLLTGFFLIAVWQILVMVLQPELLPSPLAVGKRFTQQLFEGDLLFHLWATLKRVGISFIVAFLLGSFIGALMGRYRLADTLLDGLVTLMLNIPALVTIILCFIWFGLNEFSAILAVVLNKIPLVIVTIKEAVKSFDPALSEVGEVFKTPKRKQFWQIFLPQTYPYIIIAVRTGLSLIWKIVLVVELIGCSNGIGFQLGTYFQYFDITSILAYTLAFIILVFIIEILLIKPWEKKIMRWRADGEDT